MITPKPNHVTANMKYQAFKILSAAPNTMIIRGNNISKNNKINCFIFSDRFISMVHHIIDWLFIAVIKNGLYKLNLFDIFY